MDRYFSDDTREWAGHDLKVDDLRTYCADSHAWPEVQVVVAGFCIDDRRADMQNDMRTVRDAIWMRPGLERATVFFPAHPGANAIPQFPSTMETALHHCLKEKVKAIVSLAVIKHNCGCKAKAGRSRIRIDPETISRLCGMCKSEAVVSGGLVTFGDCLQLLIGTYDFAKDTLEKPLRSYDGMADIWSAARPFNYLNSDDAEWFAHATRVTRYSLPK